MNMTFSGGAHERLAVAAEQLARKLFQGIGVIDI